MYAISLFPRFTPRLLSLGLAVCIAGCAGTKVGPVAANAPDSFAGPPHRIAVIVEDASAVPEKPSKREAHATDVRETEAALTDGLSKLLASRQLQVVPADQAADLVLRCRILEIRGGSKALRLLVGYGAGKAVLRVGLSLSDPQHQGAQPLLSFESNGTTGRMPGSGFSLPGMAGAGLNSLKRDGLPKEADQLAEHVDEEFGKYFGAQNWPYPKSDTD